MKLTLFALFITAFAIGTAEFVVAGLLPQVSVDLGVNIPTAGLLITVYAMGVAIGGPFMTLATARLPRKTALLILGALFVFANLTCAVSETYSTMVTGRLLGAFAHGAFSGIASVVAASLVPENKRASAVALVAAGVTIANVLGVPGGTALGQAWGWRATFWAISAIGLLSTLAIALWVPSGGTGKAMDLGAEVRVLGRFKVLAGLLMCFLFTVGMFGLLTFIAPLLTTVSGIPIERIPLILLVFGIGATVGVLLSGRLADWRLDLSIGLIFAAQALIHLSFVLFASNAIVIYFLMLLLGCVGMAAVAPLKTFILNASRDAPSLASTLSSSSLNFGVAVGATICSAALAWGIGYSELPWLGVACSLAGLSIIMFAMRRGNPVAIL
jgi:MFS transporter, DHA1 family, inner membrane transport protein